MPSTITVPVEQANQTPADVARAVISVATAAKADIDAMQGGTSQVGAVRTARGVVTSNVASLGAFAGVSGGTPVDGVTYVAGDRVLLVGQTTGSQNGIYVVGTVAAGTAPLTRAADWATGIGSVVAGLQVNVSEGTVFANSTWRITTTGAITVGTTTVALYPKTVKGTQALSSGSPSTATVSNLWILAGAGLSLVDITTAAAIKGVLTAGAGNGTLALTGPNTVTDSILYTITNW